MLRGRSATREVSAVSSPALAERLINLRCLGVIAFEADLRELGFCHAGFDIRHPYILTQEIRAEVQGNCFTKAVARCCRQGR